MDKRKSKRPNGTAPYAAGRAAVDDARTLRRQGRGEIRSDVLGSYTGSPDRGETPEQDADDL